MKLLFLPSALLVLLASCGPNKHVNAWDRQSSDILQTWGSRYVQEGQNDGV